MYRSATLTAISLSILFAASTAHSQTEPGPVWTQMEPRAVHNELGQDPRAAAIGDLNGDGLRDVVVASSSSESLAVYLAGADGQFQPTEGSPILAGGTSVEVGLFDGDDHLDIVSANQFKNTVSVLLGDGTGEFSPAEGSPISVQSGPESLDVGDINGDGELDFAVQAGFTPGKVQVFLGDGLGGFSEAASSPFSIVSSDGSIEMGLVDDDENLDIVAANRSDDNVTVLLGDGTGNFSPMAEGPFDVGSRPFSVALGDINNDSRQDILTANSGGDDVSILTQESDGTFTPAVSSPQPVGPGPRDLALEDIDDDGHLDLAVALFSPGVAVLLGDGSADFTATSESPIGNGSSHWKVTIVDAVGDNQPDVVALSDGFAEVELLAGDGSGGFDPTIVEPIVLGVDPKATAFADVVSGPSPDAVVAYDRRSNVEIFEGLESGELGDSVASLSTGPFPEAVAVGDLDNDGNGDIVVADFSFNHPFDVSVFLGDGNSQFDEPAGSPVAVSAEPDTIDIADVDNDGNRDLITSSGSANSVDVLLGGGDGSFAPAPDSPFTVDGSFPSGAAVGDVNGDGAVDIAVVNAFSDDVSLLLGDGSGVFELASDSPFAIGGQGANITMADLDGDSHDDIIASNYRDRELAVYLGASDASLTPAPMSPFSASKCIDIAAGNFNGDEWTDVACANGTSETVSVYLGDGNGNLSEAEGSPYDLAVPFRIALADLDDDGRDDAIVTSDGDGSGNEFVTLFTSDLLFTDDFEP